MNSQRGNQVMNVFGIIALWVFAVFMALSVTVISDPPLLKTVALWVGEFVIVAIGTLIMAVRMSRRRNGGRR